MTNNCAACTPINAPAIVHTHPHMKEGKYKTSTSLEKEKEKKVSPIEFLRTSPILVFLGMPIALLSKCSLSIPS